MYRPQVEPSSLIRLRQVIESGWIGLGPVTGQFEQELAVSDLIGKNPVAVNSGTAALHLALVVADVPKGSAVVVPANTFVSTAAVALQHQCRVILADIERATGNVDLESVREILDTEPDVSAVIAVHYAGIPCDLAGLSELSHRYGVTVIEDCAHAIGSVWQGRPMSESPNIQAYSFHATKALAIGEGGCVTFPDAASAERAKRLRRLGIDMSARSWGNPYDIPELGFKYNMGDIAAAVGLAQLEGLRENLRKRRSNLIRYRERLADSPVELVRESGDSDRSGGFAVPILVKNRERVRKELDAAGIESEIYFRPLGAFPIGATRPTPVAERFAQDVICLPIHPLISLDEIDYVCDRLSECVA
ncbi:aminotransferase DegT [Streptomyces camponoticapitis]|uniref:Aminotransferase DegT n=1 Tax=Streptomyces camponoticapitis TaxID=1616125 RepID=A0ABQ2EA02_9ACTN|nr:DegT/DnrJ/EryC1/StrS family aminotransferase [Streptomyces camponoticapitis]GGK01891.1 aminotransferase DegT [Streptomyces camponoticapitis]